MSAFQSENDKKFISAEIVAERFGYTKNYLFMLIKAGKIEGRKIKHKWFVNIDSATAYFSRAEVVRVMRRKALSADRRLELQVRSESAKQDISTHDDREESQQKKYARIAVLETILIVFLGFSFGSLGHLGVHSVSTVSAGRGSSLENIASSVYRFFAFERAEKEKDTAEDTSASLIDVEVNLSSEILVPKVSSTSLTLSTTSIDSIKQSFSDDVAVRVDAKNPSTAIVTPEFKSGTGEDYRFLMVPIELNSGTE